MIQDTIQRLGAATQRFVYELGRIAQFLGVVLLQIVKPPFRLRRVTLFEH